MILAQCTSILFVDIGEADGLPNDFVLVWDVTWFGCWFSVSHGVEHVLNQIEATVEPAGIVISLLLPCILQADRETSCIVDIEGSSSATTL